jgi:ribosome-associated protein
MPRLSAVGTSGLQAGEDVNSTPFRLNANYIELCSLLKLAGVAGSGGEGKRLVAAGEVKVDGQQESRKTAKIRAGQSVECRGVTLHILAN